MPPQISDKDRHSLQQLEEDLWRQETRFDVPYMEKVFAEDFVEFGRSGRTNTRQQILNHSSEPIEAVLPLQDFNIRLLTVDVALVTYNSAVTYDGVVEYGRRASIWSRSPTGWQLRFHQGTPYTPANS
jgi:hypothetical protein